MKEKKGKIYYPTFPIHVKKMTPLMIDFTFNCSDYGGNEFWFTYYEDTVAVEKFIKEGGNEYYRFINE